MSADAAFRTSAQSASAELGASLAADTYLRERVDPRLTDLNYLYFTDLLRVTRDLAARTEGSVFDYGCGGSPYQRFFAPGRRYIRGDVTPGAGIDRLLPADGMTNEPAESYDTVLSSQVLEHVPDPGAYLAECWRILKPGGRLILTTHGMCEEHGCPHDFTRWTSRGLEALARGRGFTVEASFKVTAEARAAVLLGHHFMEHLHYRENALVHYPLALARRFHRWLGVPILNVAGRWFRRHEVMPADDTVSLYVGVALLARKAVNSE